MFWMDKKKGEEFKITINGLSSFFFGFLKNRREK
jgi:hypothetical protein